ncbi:hypothetical protein SAMN05192561_102206 [Halopenitus malekzadehii]|uniref:Uncharacterized protein n=1 Tax=Halopenitus malekzadehii TaxID=1267564 RepID=A0A1H6II16_9EURY|nr:hypothetical protein SAMN05192561_102206 [Halopenitus malekzadehii]
MDPARAYKFPSLAATIGVKRRIDRYSRKSPAVASWDS